SDPSEPLSGIVDPICYSSSSGVERADRPLAPERAEDGAHVPPRPGAARDAEDDVVVSGRLAQRGLGEPLGRQVARPDAVAELGRALAADDLDRSVGRAAAV